MVKIKVNIILEILGRPKEHIKEALTTLVTRLGSEKGVRLVDKNIHEPTEVKDSKDLYTTFAEVSLELDSLGLLLGILLAYMPAHIEIAEPENINLTNYELNDLSNDIIRRMHDYDAIVKKALIERNFLESKLREVAPHLFKVQEKDQNASGDEIKNAESGADKLVTKKVKKVKSKKAKV